MLHFSFTSQRRYLSLVTVENTSTYRVSLHCSFIVQFTNTCRMISFSYEARLVQLLIYILLSIFPVHSPHWYFSRIEYSYTDSKEAINNMPIPSKYFIPECLAQVQVPQSATIPRDLSSTLSWLYLEKSPGDTGNLLNSKREIDRRYFGSQIRSVIR
jgi:hypothetical protein